MSSITGLSRAAIHAWRTEDRRPSLQGLVHLSYSFELPIKSWVTDKLTTSTFSSKQPRTIGETALNQRHPPLKHVRRRLLAILGDASATPCSLAELARQLNTTSHRLYRDCPELATRAVARYAEFRKVQKQERRHTQQEAVRRAIRDVAANYDGQISRSAVLELLQLRGFKSSWTLKQIFAEEIQKS